MYLYVGTEAANINCEGLREIRGYMKNGILNRIRNSKGFTLLEAALTTVILSVGLWSSLAMITTVNANTYDVDVRSIAGQLANQKIEDILAEKTFEGFSALEETSGTANAEQMTGAYEGFVRTTTITEVSADDLSTPQAGSGIKLVNVQVSWGDSEEDTMSVQTVVSETSES